MAKYKGIVTTNAGLELLAKACSGGSVKFTAVKTGDGVYNGTEDLSGMTALKSVKQSFGLSGVSRTGTQVKIRSVLNNEGLTTGYNITEIGLYAMDPDTGSEFLYAIIVAETGYEDYLPPHSDSPSSITLEIYLTLTETENDVKFTAEVVAGTYASAEDVADIISGTTQVGNAKTLDGHGTEYFAPKTDLGNYIKADGSNAWVSSVNDLNDFYTGITVVRYCENVPNDNWWLVISGGEGGTTVQTAYHLHSVETPKQRYCAGGTWSEWFDLNKHYLPLTGGEVANNGNMPFAVKSLNANDVFIPLSGYSGYLGSLGFNGTNNPVFYNTNYVMNSLLHTGNKPTGTYTGNGDATPRRIATGGTGGVCAVFGSNGTRVILFFNGYTINGTSFSDSFFGDKDIQLQTTNEALNASGVTYHYQVL